MSEVTPDPRPLTGGCNCKSLRYTITPEPYVPKPSEHNPAHTLTFPSIDICHCQTCRSITTAVFNTWIGVPPSWVSFTLRNTSGNPDQTEMVVDAQDVLNQYLFANPKHPKEAEGELRYPESALAYYSSSEGVLRAFCGKCGTGMMFAATGDVEGSVREGEWKVRDMVHLPWGTLDKEFHDEERVRPKEHCWGKEAVGWVKDGMDGKGWGEIREGA